MHDVNTKNIFYKYTARFLEFSVWILFFGLIVGLISFYNWYSHKNYSRYQVFLQDVDGIIVGSPVRMLGMQVGYVKKIKFINDMVYVDFIINEKGIEIPKGSKITIEFSGLGGSRSIEVYAPKEKYQSEQPKLTIQQPRRLSASVSLLYQMFKKIGDIMYRCTYFANSVELDKLEQKNSIDVLQKRLKYNSDIIKAKLNSRK